MLESVGRRALAIGHHRFYVIRKSAERQADGNATSFALSSVGLRRGWTSTRPAKAGVSILLYDALDFSTDRYDCSGQTLESLPRIASPSATAARLDVPTRSRFAPDVPAKFARIGSV
jgi:hypothetical protein